MMNGLYLANGKLTYRTDLPNPEPAADEALIQLRHCWYLLNRPRNGKGVCA